MKVRSLNKHLKEGDLFAMNARHFWYVHSYDHVKESHVCSLQYMPELDKKNGKFIAKKRENMFIYLGKKEGFAVAMAYSLAYKKVVEIDGRYRFIII